MLISALIDNRDKHLYLEDALKHSAADSSICQVDNTKWCFDSLGQRVSTCSLFIEIMRKKIILNSVVRGFIESNCM